MQCHMPGRGRCRGGRLGHGVDHFAMGMEQVALMQAVVATPKLDLKHLKDADVGPCGSPAPSPTSRAGLPFLEL